MWLRDFLDKDLPRARVLLFGYDAGLRSKTSTSEMEAYTTTLRSALERLRKTEEVCWHSKTGNHKC